MNSFVFCEIAVSKTRGVFVKKNSLIKRVVAVVSAALILMSVCIPVSAATFTPEFEIRSKSALLYNEDTKSIVYEKNVGEKFDPLYLTQVMTAIVVIEECSNADEIITVPQYIFNELFNKGLPTADVRAGEKIAIYDLLHCMSLQSSCEAASALADRFGDGSINAFVQKMNDKAKELGCENTLFRTPHGALAEGQYTTAEDMLKIYLHALELPLFREISSRSRYTVEKNNIHTQSRTLVTTNLLIDSATPAYYNSYVKNGKSSGNKALGRHLAASASKNGYNYVLITFGAPMYEDNGDYISVIGNLADAIEIFNWAFSSLRMRTLLSASESVAEAKVSLSAGKDYVLLYPETDYIALIAENISEESVLKVKNINPDIKAPIKKGDVLGTVSLLLANEEIAKVNLVALEDVNANPVAKGADIIVLILTSPWFIAAIVIIILLVALLIVYLRLASKNRRKYKKVRHKLRF